MAAGPDGAMWFVERFTNRVGRIGTNLAGLVETSIGITPSAGLEEIVAGPDGNLWFTEAHAKKIGRITTGGAVTEFPLTPQSQPSGITAGPDGNLWFVDNGTRIGRITPAGVVTFFSAGISSGASVNDITAGADGRLWFTEGSGNRVGRIVLDPPLAATAQAVDITPTSARLTASVNPRDYPTSHVFDFGTTAAYGSRTAAAASGDGHDNVVASTTVGGLKPATTYHFRVTATSADRLGDGRRRHLHHPGRSGPRSRRHPARSGLQRRSGRHLPRREGHPARRHRPGLQGRRRALPAARGRRVRLLHRLPAATRSSPSSP